jgi:Rac GTPase-activating protein 1
VPLPCIPYVSRANIGKHGKLILISDFVQSNCRPCVPALIVHCAREIEKNLDEIGIYRVAASEVEVRELKEKILKSKHGIPQLIDIDVHVLCNVIKKFLNQLDEALVSCIAWRDFVEAVNISDEEDRKQRIKEAILNLPNANRDTLAFLMLHLRRIADNPDNKMNVLAISRIFGPTVLGYSMRDPPHMQIFEENKKQHQVVEYLVNLDDEFWQSILDLGSANHLNFSLGPADLSNPSIGSRLWGGKVNSGIITPLKNKKSNASYNIKPLF